MFTTVRVHMNPKESCFSLEHNRNKSFREKEAHIDGTSNNFEVWSNLGVYNAYKEVFGDTIQAYNDKQKRKDRKILDENGDAVGGYIQTIQTSRRGKKERVVYKDMPDGTKEVVGKRQESQGQRLLYELVVSAGNCEKERDDEGRIIYTDDGHESHPYRLPYEVNRAACKELSDRFEELYPHFKMACSSWHGDEFYLNANGVAETGIEHVHINFIPWADGYKRGLSIQASISKALEQMGFVSGMDDNGVWHNAYYYWTQDVQKNFEDILREKYAEHLKEFANKEYGENSLFAAITCVETLHFIHPAKGKNLTNLDPAEYRELKDVKRQVNVAYEELDDVQDKIDAKSEALERAEQVITQAEEKEKNLAVTIASKLDEAEQYYMARKEEADDLLRKAEETYQARLQEAELRFGHIVRAYKKISDELEFYKKRCWNVLAKKMSLTISDKMLERWMKKNKIVRNEKWVSVYDACAADISRLGCERAKDQYKAADALQKEVQRQLEFTQESSDTDEDDTGYAYAE